MNIKIIAQEQRASTGELMVMTDQSRHPIVVPHHIRETNLKWGIDMYLISEINRRLRDRLLRDNRHDHFKAFRA